MDRLSFLFSIGLVVLLLSTMGAALGHPVAELSMPVFLWYDGFLVEDELVIEQYLPDMPPNIREEINEDVTIITHVVVRGDTVKSIAKQYGIEENTIIINNNISNPNLIVVGQQLRFPSVDGLIHTVKRGDTIYGLAQTYGITIEDILEVNEVEPTALTVGSILILPNAKPVAAQRTVVPSRSGVTTTVASIPTFRNLLWPVNGVITSPYGWRRNPFNSAQTQFHRGLDIGASRGTPILAATSGKVVHSGWLSGYGYTVILEHDNNYTLYAHASSLSVKKGQWVEKGQEIARVGATGNATGPHLHFEIRIGGNSSSKAVNPINYLQR
ncbi:peptidoglycan DD-metalloendopeptidase family protein [Anaerobranca gottschalkii]|uniref:Murein DD-endopeptidase MepM and murein hydrolase activator NlpD, contain LysM domain n=1 Tax=Anaerobranca gottschalkii DSM 13577 TaxID=1120990 RepID=A0A1H9ZUK3_9FIRM|nr:M23 family metallopeptidase [Anaerobranca gottschalkii]SES85472.1 Murein DD-endopeptidase MepM and murein hydrolase activator NlpD, contain LysM domain [Anaerobranca gottschalkii DSM 13577]